MRRIGLIVTSLMFLCLLTGCGEKKLVCSTKEDNQEASVTFAFDSKDKIKSGKMSIVFKIEEEISEEELDDSIKLLQDSYKEMGFDTKVSKGKNSVTINLNFKADQLDELFGSDTDYNLGYDALKAELEDEGATCK